MRYFPFNSLTGVSVVSVFPAWLQFSFGSGAPQCMNHAADKVKQSDSSGADIHTHTHTHTHTLKHTHWCGSDTPSLSSGSLLKRPKSLMNLSISSRSGVTVKRPAPGDGTIMKSHVLIFSHSCTYLWWFSWCVVSGPWCPVAQQSVAASSLYEEATGRAFISCQ